MIIKCPECGAEISDLAPQCIHCGYPLNNKVTTNMKNTIHEDCPICHV